MSQTSTTPSNHVANNSSSRPTRRPGPWAVAALLIYWTALGIATHIPLRMAKRVQHGDKLVHLVAYAGLASLLYVVVALFRRVTWKTHLAMFVAIAVYATADELLQDFVPHRTSDLKDWSADLLGAGLSLLLCGAVHRRFFSGAAEREE